MKKKSLNRLSAFFNISLVVLLLVPNFIVSASVFAVDTVFPSTNEINKTKVWSQVNILEELPGSTKFEVKNPRGFLACFEYRTDGDITQKISDINTNIEVTDGLYPNVCVTNTVETITISANVYVEIRLAFGGEKDERFTWTRFDVLPVPIPPSVPILEYPIDGVAIKDNTPLMQWSKLGAFTVDTTNPNTTLVPPEGLTGNTFAVSGEAEDNISLNRVYVQLVHKQTSQRYGGTTIYLSGTKQDWSQTFDATKLGMPEGDYAAHVAVVDNAGNTSSVGWSEYFQVDKTPPVITISSPLNNEVLRTPERKLKVFGSISDNIATNYIHIQIVDSKGNSRGVYTVHGTKSEELLVELDVKDLQDGEYKIYYWGVDRVGNVSERPYITILLDNTAPVAPTLTSPSNDSFVKGDLLESKWKKIDDAHNYIYESYHDAEAKNLRYHQEYATNSKSATNVSESTFWWRVKAVDAAGNASDWSELWKVTVDNTPPK